MTIMCFKVEIYIIWYYIIHNFIGHNFQFAFPCEAETLIDPGSAERQRMRLETFGSQVTAGKVLGWCFYESEISFVTN